MRRRSHGSNHTHLSTEYLPVPEKKVTLRFSYDLMANAFGVLQCYVLQSH